MATPILVPLGHREKRIWEPTPGGMGGRRGRRGGTYEAFVPAEIAGRDFPLDGDVVAVVASATKALAQLNSSHPRLASANALAAALLRSESAASSRIEGLAISHKRLARAALKGAGKASADDKAVEILGNVEAMRRAIEIGAAGERISVADIREIHRTLLRFTGDRAIAGAVREQQNWIGGNDFNPLDAVYVPPPPERVLPLLDDLCGFMARDDLAPVVQAAIAHAQFENIHPFADGNGRVGRALIHAVLRRADETIDYVPPISLAFVAAQRSYIGGIGEYSAGDVSSWCDLFAAATEMSVAKARQMADQIENLESAWLRRLGEPRRDAAVRQVVSHLPGQPVVDVATACALTGRSHVAIQKALTKLEELGIVRRLNERKWGRAWECPELLDLIEVFEESAAEA